MKRSGKWRMKLFSAFVGFGVAVVLYEAAFTLSAHAQPTSLYTDLDTAAGVTPGCETLEQAEPGDGEWARVRCPGPGGVWAHIDYDDARDTIRVGPDGKGTQFEPAFTSVGPKIEWRMKGEVPVAMIVRLTRQGGGRTSQSLTVHKVDATSGNGCLVGEVAASGPEASNANERARRIADDVAHGFDCATDQPVTGQDLRSRIVARKAPARLLPVSIKTRDCSGVLTENFVGGLNWSKCSNGVLVARVAGHAIVAYGKPARPIHSIPVSYRIQDTVHIVIDESNQPQGVLVQLTLIAPDDSPDVEVWQLVRGPDARGDSCVAEYAPGRIETMDGEGGNPAKRALQSIALAKRFAPTCRDSRNPAFYNQGSDNAFFRQAMRLMNVGFAP